MSKIIGWIIGLVVAYFALLLIFNILGAVGSAIFGVGKYEGENAEYWYNEYDAEASDVEDLKTKVNNLQDALTEANSNIDEANSEINNIKMYSWESYDDMGNAIDSLSTVSNVSEP